MDDNKLEELKKQSAIDNSKLEELMSEKFTVESQNDFLELFKESQLLMPVTMSANVFEGIENAKEGDIFELEDQVGFDINFLTGNDGSKAVPLFTSDEMMEKGNCRSSSIAIFMSDLAEMLKQTDRYSAIAINPFTEHDIVMPMEIFLSLFSEPTEEQKKMLETMNETLKILKEKSIELEEDYAFYVRDNEPFMKDLAIDGVFVPNIPFNASSKKDFKSELKYLNILIMPKTTKIVYTGGIVDEDAYDTIIAPGSEFHHVEDIDEFTSVWKCEAQPFYD